MVILCIIQQLLHGLKTCGLRQFTYLYKCMLGVKIIYFLGVFLFNRCKFHVRVNSLPYELIARFYFLFSYFCCFFFYFIFYFFIICFCSCYDSLCCSNIVASFYHLIIWLFEKVFVYGVCDSCLTAGLFRWSNVSGWEMS